MSHCKYYAHRGAHWLAPENTMKAFKMAYDHGFHGVEFDVQLTKDFVPIVFHDHKWDKLTNSKGLVQNTLYKDLASIRVRNEPIPTLETFLEQYNQNEFYLELKIPLNTVAGYRDILWDKVHNLLPSPNDKQFIASFDSKILKNDPDAIFISENSYHPKYKQSLAYSFWERSKEESYFLWDVPPKISSLPDTLYALILDSHWQKYHKQITT